MKSGMTGEEWVTLVTDGGFGRKLGEYEGRTVLMGVKTDETEDEFCVVVYWNDPETNEGVLIATVDNSHGQPVHVDKYREGEKKDREVVGSGVSTVYEAEQYAKDNWHRFADFHFSG